MTIKQKLTILIALLAVTGAVIGIAVSRSLLPLNDAFHTFNEASRERAHQVDLVQTEFGYGGAIHSFKNLVLRGQPKYADAFTAAHQRIVGALDTYVELPGVDAEEQAAVAAIRQAIDQYADGVALTRKMLADGAAISEIDQSVKVNDAPAIAGIELLTERADRHLAEAETAFAEQVSASYYNVLSALGACLALLLVAVVAIVITIGKPLRGLVERFEQISHDDADLSKRLPVSGNDELATISSGFNDFCEKVGRTIEQIGGAAERLSVASRDIASANDESQSSIGEQRAALTQLVGAMSQMTASFQNVVSSACNASEAADRVDKDASAGRQVVKTNVELIHAVALAVEQAKTVITRLERDSENIGSVLDVIRGIAEQTNLLALNAAIEAARAGDQGRGFAVVADEVRTLARRTQESTEEIRQMIEGLQSASTEAVSAMAEGRDKVQASVEEADKVRETLDQIAHGVQEMRDLNNQIATASEQQNGVAQEMDRNLGEVASKMEQTSASASHAAEISGQFKDLADDLNAQVSSYHAA